MPDLSVERAADFVFEMLRAHQINPGNVIHTDFAEAVNERECQRERDRLVGMYGENGRDIADTLKL